VQLRVLDAGHADTRKETPGGVARVTPKATRARELEKLSSAGPLPNVRAFPIENNYFAET
jgi:hypothetical protein